MSYTPTEWQTGDTITAAGLNKMEQGIAGAAVRFLLTSEYVEDTGGRLIVHASLNEIKSAVQSGAVVIASGHLVDSIYYGFDLYTALFFVQLAEDNSAVHFWGFDPYSGGNSDTEFYVDASGETMSTDGGYVP